MKPQLVVYGASAHASCVLDILHALGQYSIVGLLDDVNTERWGGTAFGYPVLGGAGALDDIVSRGVRYGIVGFGHTQRRLETAEALTAIGIELVSAVHPSAIIGSASSIDAGTVVKAGAIIDPGVLIGKNVIVGSGVVVTHGARLGDGVRLSAGATIGADAVVERGAFVGLAATVSTAVTIGTFSIVGAGSLVLRDIDPRMVAYGTPARAVRPVSTEAP
ncbi:MAG: NeuD/PglB/VioB family sugar acetyltransferase [Rhodothermia bacterium]|nr:NeuD/PglB/VioB family sugar acetyltransferase [Rhodothermia bacterium]